MKRTNCSQLKIIVFDLCDEPWKLYLLITEILSHICGPVQEKVPNVEATKRSKTSLNSHLMRLIKILNAFTGC